MRVFAALLIGVITLAAAAARAQDIDWQKVDDALGRKAAVVSGDAHRYGFPRTDLTVTLDGVIIKPSLALGGWVAFKDMHGEAMLMGDLVLLETEINPVMTKLIENGGEITAVHNHLLRGNPETFYMHVGGHGDPVKLATAIHTALAASKTPLAPPGHRSKAEVCASVAVSGRSRASRSITRSGGEGQWAKRSAMLARVPTSTPSSSRSASSV